LPVAEPTGQVTSGGPPSENSTEDNSLNEIIPPIFPSADNEEETSSEPPVEDTSLNAINPAILPASLEKESETSTDTPHDDTADNSIVPPSQADEPADSDTQLDAVPNFVEQAAVNWDNLVGTWRIRGAYLIVFEEAGTYYFNFVVNNLQDNHLEFPVPLSVTDSEAVAAYTDDSCGNSGSVRFTSDIQGRFFLTASVDNKYVEQFNSSGDLNALIADSAQLYCDKEITEYPIYMDYLDPTGFNDPVNLSFLELYNYSKISDALVDLTFDVLDNESVIFQINDDGVIEYEGTAYLVDIHKEYVVLEGRDDNNSSITVKLECHYDGICHVITSDDYYKGTVFR